MFIVLEGLDGVGKSTLIKGLREAIDANYQNSCAMDVSNKDRFRICLMK